VPVEDDQYSEVMALSTNALVGTATAGRFDCFGAETSLSAIGI
jgi:hypothetical protein